MYIAPKFVDSIQTGIQESQRFLSSVLEGLIEIGIHRGTTNGDVFLQFINDKLVPNLLPFNGVNPRSVVFMGMTFFSMLKTLSAI